MFITTDSEKVYCKICGLIEDIARTPSFYHIMPGAKPPGRNSGVDFPYIMGIRNTHRYTDRHREGGGAKKLYRNSTQISLNN